MKNLVDTPHERLNSEYQNKKFKDVLCLFSTSTLVNTVQEYQLLLTLRSQWKYITSPFGVCREVETSGKGNAT